MVIRTYWFPGFNQASGTSTRNWCHGTDHVEAWRPRVCRSYPTILPLEGMNEHASDRWLPPVEPRPEGHVTPNAAISTPPPAAPAADERPPWEEDKRGLLRRIGSALLAGLIAIVKFGKVALLFAGKLKILTTSGTMLVSVAAYSLIWGWKFALGFVVLLLVHEMGHVIQLRREGVEASAPVFIPFLGAVVAAKSLGDDALAEARVGLAGPILGTHRRRGAAADRRDARATTSGRPWPSPGSSSTSSTCCPSSRSTAAARWPRCRRGCGSSASSGSSSCCSSGPTR